VAAAASTAARQSSRGNKRRDLCMCDMTRIYVSSDLYICATCLTFMCDVPYI